MAAGVGGRAVDEVSLTSMSGCKNVKLEASNQFTNQRVTWRWVATWSDHVLLQQQPYLTASCGAGHLQVFIIYYVCTVCIRLPAKHIYNPTKKMHSRQTCLGLFISLLCLFFSSDVQWEKINKSHLNAGTTWSFLRTRRPRYCHSLPTVLHT